MLVPGFSVHELPLKLTNVTNLRYRHDGKLVALGYDGRLHLLSDTDGDGLEDKAEVFWDKAPLRAPIGLDLLPKNNPRGEGAFVASKAKVSLILDKDRDGRAEEEIVAASGWNETFHGVDTLGLAVDPKDGAIFFSIGCANFTDGYLRDAAGKSTYRLDSPRGTIQRVSADFKTRETVCTGVRFACALAFNRLGDLFATEQEGATWLPNGNPFDELLHLERGRHYGFPPRHPRHLPDVLDEPAVMEYGPQHQSTVGMVFNEGVNGGPAFGPASWVGDALVCGESRGKLYRTKLAKTPQGYVAQNHLIACLGLLTVDTCVSPQADLLIACHSGPPDWGTGPVGEGRIFKVRHARKEIPQPVHAWAAARDEFRIAFDRPLQPDEWAGAKDKVRIEAGHYVSAGDRYEVIRPGYQAVRDQMAAPRRWVDLHSLSLSADRRSLVLRVPQQTEDVTYAVTLPIPAKWQSSGGIAQRPEMDVAISLHGLQATAGDHRIVLPHPSFPVSRALTAGSADHAAFFAAAAQAGASGMLAGRIDVSNLFVPATQPGTSLDWDIAHDPFANRLMTVLEDFSTGTLRKVESPVDGSNQKLELVLKKGFNASGSGLALALDDKVRPVPVPRLLLPWAAAASEKPAAGRPVARTDVKGRWLHGRRLFFGEAACFTCHTIRGEGMVLGPDLTNLVFRDRDSVLQDIVQPSATLNPDHPGTTLTFTDGTSLTGVLGKLDEEKAVMRLAAGAVIERSRRDVAKVEPMKTSLMTEGYRERLSTEAMEDLLTFLLTNPLEPAPITRLEPPIPPARTRAEMAAFFVPPSTAPARPLRILLSGGVKDHGIDEHDYPLWLERWARLLALAEGVTVATSNGFPSQAQLDGADVTVFYSNNAGWNLGAAALLDRYQQRGGGAVYLHWGIEGHKDAAALAERAGLAFSFSAFRHGEMDLVFTNRDHPITRGFDRLHFVDESYWKLHGDRTRLGILATSLEDQQPQPQLWTLERGQARVFGCIPGHYTWTFDDPLYRLLVLRGIAWAAKQDDVNRLAELMTVGARLAP
jgi:putative heme-binding domain-containing protein